MSRSLCATRPGSARHEQLVAKVMPEASQRSAHCRLTEMESVTRTRDVTLGQQRIKRHEQVQIEEVQVHSVTIGWLRLVAPLMLSSV